MTIVQASGAAMIVQLSPRHWEISRESKSDGKLTQHSRSFHASLVIVAPTA